MIRARLAARLRDDNGRCVDCGERRGPTWVRSWRIRLSRPWTYVVPLIERRCYDCGIDATIDDVVATADD